MTQLTGINNKIAVITGGSQGLGLFAQRGAKGLILCGRQTTKGTAVVEEIRQLYPGCEVHFVTADLAQIDSPKRIIQAAQEHFGQLDILINVAGLSARGSILDTTPELYDRIMNINVRAPFFLIQEAAKLMRSRGTGGTMVSIGSIAAYAGMPILTAYCTFKGALNTLTRSNTNA